MKPVKLGLVVAASITGLAVAVPAYAAPPAPTPTGPAASAPVANLSDEERTGLAFSRDEERMARDLYQAISQKHSLAEFSRIANSEQRHFDAIGRLLTRYQVADPAKDAKAGAYADPQLQKLYDDWHARAMATPEAAWQVGIELEKRDIADLKRLAEATTNADLDRVYANLTRGSEHHLAAFEAYAKGEIPNHQGQGMKPGEGRGQGQGRSNDQRPNQNCADHEQRGPGPQGGPRR